MISHPKNLLSLSDINSKSTNYNIKIRVSRPLMLYKAINICIMNEKGDAILKRLTNTSLDFETLHQFDGPDIEGQISMIMLAPEDDNIYLKDVRINIENQDKIADYEFIYDNVIGGGRGAPLVACMKPLIKSDIDMKPIYDEEYKQLKKNIILQTSELSLIGTVIMSCVSGIDAGYAFGIGGVIGLLYMKLLQNEIDIIDKKSKNVFGHSASRLALIICLVVTIVTIYKEQIHNDQLLFLDGVIGFLIYKIAIIESYIEKK